MYVEEKQIINSQTGEIQFSERLSVSKQNKEEYIRIFLDTINIITNAKLTAIQHNVLYALQKFTINNSNLIFYNSAIRQKIANDLDIKEDTVKKAVLKLLKTKILIKEKNLYYLNPLHFGRGDWKNVKKLRKTLILDFDFEKLEAYKTDKIQTFYENETEMKEKLIEAKEHNLLETDIKIDNDKKEIQKNIKIKENNIKKEIEELKKQLFNITNKLNSLNL